MALSEFDGKQVFLTAAANKRSSPDDRLIITFDRKCANSKVNSSINSDKPQKESCR